MGGGGGGVGSDDDGDGGGSKEDLEFGEDSPLGQHSQLILQVCVFQCIYVYFLSVCVFLWDES